MADEIQRIPQDDVTRTWTLVLRGGDWLAIKLPRHPGLSHDGFGPTIWKVCLTGSEKDELVAYIQSQMATVEVFTETQSVEQSIFRMATTGRSGLL